VPTLATVAAVPALGPGAAVAAVATRLTGAPSPAVAPPVVRAEERPAVPAPAPLAPLAALSPPRRVPPAHAASRPQRASRHARPARGGVRVDRRVDQGQGPVGQVDAAPLGRATVLRAGARTAVDPGGPLDLVARHLDVLQGHVPALDQDAAALGRVRLVARLGR